MLPPLHIWNATQGRLMAIESPHLIDLQSSRRRLCYLFIWPIRSLLSSILRHSYGISFHSELTRAFDSVFDFTVNSIFDLAFDCTTGRVFTPFLTRHRHTLPSLPNDGTPFLLWRIPNCTSIPLLILWDEITGQLERQPGHAIWLE